MNAREQKKLGETYKQMEQLKKTIDEGQRLLRWMQRRKKKVPTEAHLRVSISGHNLTAGSYSSGSVYARLPAEVVRGALTQPVKDLVAACRQQLKELELP